MRRLREVVKANGQRLRIGVGQKIRFGFEDLADQSARIVITFGVLYCFFVRGHDRRRILHFNATRHPTSAWIVQQLRETFP